MQPGEDKPVSFSFPKKERLCSRLQMEQLLSLKQSVFSYPLKCYFQHLPLSDENPVSKMAVSVPKKLEKTAVGRNKIKRWVREAYRLNKHLLHNRIEEGRVVNMLFVCVGKENLSYVLMEKAMKEIFQKINGKDDVHIVSTEM
jgi:ribonuclease P protein component